MDSSQDRGLTERAYSGGDAHRPSLSEPWLCEPLAPRGSHVSGEHQTWNGPSERDRGRIPRVRKLTAQKGIRMMKRIPILTSEGREGTRKRRGSIARRRSPYYNGVED